MCELHSHYKSPEFNSVFKLYKVTVTSDDCVHQTDTEILIFIKLRSFTFLT
jgi:hypothetical protein